MAAFGFNPASAVKLLLLALLIPPVSRYFAGRYYTLSRIYANRPHKLPPVNASFVATTEAGGSGGRHAVLFADRIRNCEDGFVVPELGVAFLSCDPGRDGWNTVMGAFAEDQDANPGGQIWLYRYAKDVVAADDDATMRLQRLGLSGFPEPNKFHPIGIAYDHPTRTLFVLNNDVRGPRLEVFRYKPSIISPVLKHLGTIEDPLIYSPNSVEVVSSTELYITNDHRFPARYHPTLSTLENYLLFAKGTVVRVKLSSKLSTMESIRTVASLPFANGIARLNESTMVVASTNTASIHFYSMPAAAAATNKEEDQGEQLPLTGVVKLPFLPDNLSVDEKGKLLIAGHPSPPELTQVSRSRALCQDERVRNPKAEDPKHCRKAMAPSWAAEWTEAGGLRDLYVSRGGEAGGYGTTATAVRDSARGVGFLTGLYDEGILKERWIPLASSPVPSTCVLMTESGSLLGNLALLSQMSLSAEDGWDNEGTASATWCFRQDNRPGHTKLAGEAKRHKFRTAIFSFQAPPAFVVEPTSSHNYSLILSHRLGSNGDKFGRELVENRQDTHRPDAPRAPTKCALHLSHVAPPSLNRIRPLNADAVNGDNVSSDPASRAAVFERDLLCLPPLEKPGPDSTAHSRPIFLGHGSVDEKLSFLVGRGNGGDSEKGRLQSRAEYLRKPRLLVQDPGRGIPDDDRSSLQGSMIFSNALSLTHPDIQAGRRMASTYSQ
ncbi:hypothetical protein M0657_008426 [Pyricularia oryzae]|nr:hypothetical protein M9X92_009666 [Pyricularia oryzae]KAI7916763.1 hypothetical protein M0657_008426 [Pyricularia oryzae]